MRATFLALALLFGFATAADAAPQKRVALVIGQNAYPGGATATAGLPRLNNSVPDAREVAALLAKHGFEIVSCDGKTPGCFDLDRAALLTALDTLKARAAGADMALVYYSGHGIASDEGNILASTDAKVDCKTGAVKQGVPVERLMQAASPARHKFLILDACRDNPIGDICPGLKGKKLSFTRIEAGNLEGFLLVTSTQFGQTALDGVQGAHSPFATSLLAALEANPHIYFEQVMNEVARTTRETAQKTWSFFQNPGKVVGGAAPADCLAGEACVGDPRMAALSAENEKLAGDAAGVRALLEREERDRGKPYTLEERKARVAALEATLASIGKSTDPLRQEGGRLLKEGDVAGGQAKLDEALDADEKAIAEAERVATERKKSAAQGARDLAVLATGRDALKALGYYRRAVKLDASDAMTWNYYGDVAIDAGRQDEAKEAYKQGALAAERAGVDQPLWWAISRLGEVALKHGDLPAALSYFAQGRTIAEAASRTNPRLAQWWHHYLSISYAKLGEVQVAQSNLGGALENFRRMSEIVDRLSKSFPENDDLQGDLAASYIELGDVLMRQGKLPEALKSFRDSLAIADRLAKSDPGNAFRQGVLSISYLKVGEVLVKQGNLPEALKNFRDSLAIRDRLAKSDPGNAAWQASLSESYMSVGRVLVKQGNLPEALKNFRDSLAIRDRLAQSDPSNVDWQRDLAEIHRQLAGVYQRQGEIALARDALGKGLEIMQHLTALSQENATWNKDLARLQKQIAELPFAVVKAQVESAFSAGSFPEAAAAQAKLAEAIEKAERNQDGRPGRQTASAQLSLSWHRLFSRDFEGALAASERAAALWADPLFATNKAHALMFIGREREARALYLLYKGQPVNKGGKLWEAAILDDFAEFEKRGLKHKQMVEIRALLAMPAPQQR